MAPCIGKFRPKTTGREDQQSSSASEVVLVALSESRRARNNEKRKSYKQSDHENSVTTVSWKGVVSDVAAAGDGGGMLANAVVRGP